MRKRRLLVNLIVILCLALIVIPVLAACSKTTPTTPTTPTPKPETPKPETKEVLIRVTTPVPPGDTMVEWGQEGMDRFNARTNGAYKMQIFPGGQLAAFPESMDAIRTGSIEAGMIPLAAFGGTVPEFGLPELPFIWASDRANDYAMPQLQEVFSPLLEEKANQTSVGCFTVGTLNILSKKQIKTLEDLEGLIVGCDTPPMAELIKALGGSGIIVDFTEDYSSLQKGVIDAKTCAPPYILIAKLYEAAKYYTTFHALGTLYSFDINLDVYNEMPDDVKQALNEEMSATAAFMSTGFVDLYYELQDDLVDAGVEIYHITPAERDRWKELAYPTTIAVLDGAGDIGATIKQIADEANAKFPYKAE
jgi:TRAP-type C4-dicarboxylate transport system substrate-binding protein